MEKAVQKVPLLNLWKHVEKVSLPLPMLLYPAGLGAKLEHIHVVLLVLGVDGKVPL